MNKKRSLKLKYLMSKYIMKSSEIS